VCQRFLGRDDKIAFVAAQTPDSINSLMADLRRGSEDAAGQLVELFYPELRRLASTRMRNERINHTWQPTVLVNELYLELTRIKSLPPGTPDDAKERDAFFGLAAFLMKRLLARHARPLPQRVTKAEVDEALDLAVSGEQALREIEDLLTQLSAIDPKLRLVVEMKAFEGLSREEIAQRLNCSVRTVARHWDFAQYWLQKEMTSGRRA